MPQETRSPRDNYLCNHRGSTNSWEVGWARPDLDCVLCVAVNRVPSPTALDALDSYDRASARAAGRHGCALCMISGTKMPEHSSASTRRLLCLTAAAPGTLSGSTRHQA